MAALDEAQAARRALTVAPPAAMRRAVRTRPGSQ